MEKPQPYFLHSRVPHATEWTALWAAVALLWRMMMMPWQDDPMGLGRGWAGNGGRTILVGWKLCAVIICCLMRACDVMPTLTLLIYTKRTSKCSTALFTFGFYLKFEDGLMKICNTGNHGSVSFKLDDIFVFLASHHNAAMPSSLCHFFTSNRHHNIIVQAIHFFGKEKGITTTTYLKYLIHRQVTAWILSSSRLSSKRRFRTRSIDRQVVEIQKRKLCNRPDADCIHLMPTASR